MKGIGDTAFVVSVHCEASTGTLRVNLKWQGERDISAFDLDHLGSVVHCETETEDTGWVIIEPHNQPNTYPGELLVPFGPSTFEPSFPISAGDTIPLRNRGPTISKSLSDFACFWHCVRVCAKQRGLVTMARCFAEELAKCCRRSGMTKQPG
jgi:hypothetical protein